MNLTEIWDFKLKGDTMSKDLKKEIEDFLIEERIEGVLLDHIMKKIEAYREEGRAEGYENGQDDAGYDAMMQDRFR